MDLHHQFEVAAPVTDVWPAFLDMPRLAPCMPGAEITEVIDDRNVKGAAKVKVGPVNLRFAGTGEMTDVDNDARSANLKAKGSDAKGRGNADADIRFQLTDAGSGSTGVDVTTSLSLTGSVAQYGRASGLIDEIANQLIAQFVQNLETELSPAPEPADVGEPPDTSDATSDARTATPLERAKPQAVKAVSGISVFFKALLAMIRKRLGRQ